MVNQVNSNTTQPNQVTTKGDSTMGKDDFMKLMLAQLKYQDPLSPLEGAEFAAQLAQFSSLEQLSNLNESMNTSIDANYLLTQSINNTMSATLVGKNIKLNGSGLTYSGQEEIQLGYVMPADVTTGKINIYNENNVLVKTIEDVDLSKGEHKLSWDFSDNNGSTVPKGNYRFEVEATGAGAQKLTIETFKFGKIDAIRFTTDGTKLIVGGAEYYLSDILEVYEPGNNNEVGG